MGTDRGGGGPRGGGGGGQGGGRPPGLFINGKLQPLVSRAPRARSLDPFEQRLDSRDFAMDSPVFLKFY
jgi:hypothetical protein